MSDEDDELTVAEFQRIQTQYERDRREADQKAGVLQQIKADLGREGYESFEDAESALARELKKRRRLKEKLDADIEEYRREVDERDDNTRR